MIIWFGNYNYQFTVFCFKQIPDDRCSTGSNLNIQSKLCWIDIPEKSLYWSSISENLGDASGLISVLGSDEDDL